MIHNCSIHQTWNFKISFSLDASCFMLDAGCHFLVKLRERIWGSMEERASYNDYVLHLEEPPSLLSNMQNTPRGFDKSTSP